MKRHFILFPSFRLRHDFPFHLFIVSHSFLLTFDLSVSSSLSSSLTIASCLISLRNEEKYTHNIKLTCASVYLYFCIFVYFIFLWKRRKGKEKRITHKPKLLVKLNFRLEKLHCWMRRERKMNVLFFGKDKQFDCHDQFNKSSFFPFFFLPLFSRKRNKWILVKSECVGIFSAFFIFRIFALFYWKNL